MPETEGTVFQEVKGGISLQIYLMAQQEEGHNCDTGTATYHVSLHIASYRRLLSQKCCFDDMFIP
jgi:hypothetical protein